jgi:hypothetical protein
MAKILGKKELSLKEIFESYYKKKEFQLNKERRNLNWKYRPTTNEMREYLLTDALSIYSIYIKMFNEIKQHKIDFDLILEYSNKFSIKENLYKKIIFNDKQKLFKKELFNYFKSNNYLNYYFLFQKNDILNIYNDSSFDYMKENKSIFYNFLIRNDFNEKDIILYIKNLKNN